MRLFSSKKKVIAIVAVLALVLSGVAVAYYAGSGSGSNANAAKAGASPQAVIVTVDSNASALYPGDSEPIAVHITSLHGRPRIGTVTFDVNPSAAGCLASWFSIDPVVVNGQTPQDVTGTLYFNDSFTDQSACSDSDIAVTATASP